MRSFAVAALALAACSAGHEVQLTIKLDDSVNAGYAAQIRTLQIAVLGVERGSYSYAIEHQLDDRKTTWLYKSKTDGQLLFSVVALGTSSVYIASGKSSIVESGGKTASATVVLASAPPSPNKHRLGEACTAGVDTCASGYCVDGVCCDSTCDGSCNTCNGSIPGTCSPALAGENPRKACKVDPQNPCVSDGTCDGAGACRVPPAGAVCAQPSCAGGTYTSAEICNGMGQCLPATTRACAPYACNAQGSDCATICTTTSGCAMGVTCNFGRCGQVDIGAYCVADGDCAMGSCVDGVCCSTPCTGACSSCAQPGQQGSCVFVTAGEKDPHGVCTDQGLASCGNNGLCDGSGGCSVYPKGTVCVAGACSSDGTHFTPPEVCGADGRACPIAATISCAPYLCSTDGAPGCGASCGECTYYAADKGPPFAADCAAGASCTDDCLSPSFQYVCQ
jgi:hypothetical protein